MTDQSPDPAEKLFDYLASRWTRPEWDQVQFAVYVADLEDVPFDELQAAVRRLGRTAETWRPDPAAIRRTVVELRGLFPSLMEATVSGTKYAEVMASYARSGEARGSIPDLHPVVRDAARTVDPAESPAAFAKAYREAVNDVFVAIQAGDLRTSVTFAAVQVAGVKPRPLTWRSHGWWRPDGTLERADAGDRFPGQLGAPDAPAAIGAGA